MKGTQFKLSGENWFGTRFLDEPNGGMVGGEFNIGDIFIYERDIYKVTRKLYDLDQQCWVIYAEMADVELEGGADDIYG